MAWGARQGSSAWPLNSPLTGTFPEIENDVRKCVRMGGRRNGWVAGWVDGVMGLRVGFKNINDMYNNDVGKGVVYVYEAYEVK